jgi:2-aminoadipate transaminase
MLDSIRRFFPAEVEVNAPKGGFFVWARLPRGLSASRLFPAALEKKVAYVVGDAFYTAEGRGENTLRLTFCAVDETKIAEGIQRLGGVFKDALLSVGR